MLENGKDNSYSCMCNSVEQFKELCLVALFLQYIHYTALKITPSLKIYFIISIRISFCTFWRQFHIKIEIKILKYTTKASQKCHSDSYQTQSLNCSTDLYIKFYEISLPFSSIMDPNVLNYASFQFIRLPPYHRTKDITS